MQVELHSWVEPSALYAAAAVASHSHGWAAVAKRLDHAQYVVFMHELGMKWRLSTRVAMKIILTRARALCLKSQPPGLSSFFKPQFSARVLLG